MTEKLPARPNLEHLRTQAKTLLSDLKKGDKAAAALFIKHLPAAKRLTAAKVFQSEFRLADAQSVVARQAGFSSWPVLGRLVTQLRELEGTWEFVDLEVDGNKVPDAALANSRMLIDGDRFRMESPEADYEGIFTIDVEEVPHRIDIEFVEGPEAGNWSYGIFEVDGDHFKICLGLTGASRPGGFKTSRGSGHALENLRRVLKTRPDRVAGGKRQSPPKAPPKSVKVDESAFDADLMTPVLAKLQGEWLPVQLIFNGQPLADMLLPMGSRTTTGNEMKVVFGGQVQVHARMRTDDSKSPIEIDYLNIGRASKGQISLGLMRWIADEVEICMSAPGQPRASDFTCDRGCNRTLSRWRRK
jgi:uncharacterized protein (TIGR03067 family)